MFLIIVLASMLPCYQGLFVGFRNQYPYALRVPNTPVNLLFPLPETRVICSACNCDDDFFCGWNCGKCKTEEFCESCGCLTSLGCGRNCQKCSNNANDPGIAEPAPVSGSDCVASSGPASGRKCIFPFTYNGVRYEGCAPLYGDLVNVYSQVYWCSTKVDFNGFHIRSLNGKYVGFCDETCPKVSGTYYLL